MDTLEKGVLHKDTNEEHNLERTRKQKVPKDVNDTTTNDMEDIAKHGAKNKTSSLDNEPQDPTPTTAPPFKSLSFLDQYLVLWILLSMALGIILSNLVPSTGPTLQRGEFVGVSIPIAIGLLVMMYPILCKVRYETLHHLLKTRTLWYQIGISFVLNWILAPLFMTGLAWAFLPDRRELRDGLIFVGVDG